MIAIGFGVGLVIAVLMVLLILKIGGWAGVAAAFLLLGALVSFIVAYYQGKGK